MRLYLAVLLLAYILQANAASFSGVTILSVFQGCAGAPGGPTYQPTPSSQCTFSGSGAGTVRWGVPYLSGGEQSGLRFEPNSPTTLTTDSDTYIGKLIHFNFRLSDATNDLNAGKTEIPSVVNLRLQVTIPIGGGQTRSLTPSFPLQLQETLNQAFQLNGGTCTQANNNPDWQLPDQGITGWNSGLPCCPYGSITPCSDKISFNALTDATTSIDDGTTLYTLQLTGFKDSTAAGGNPVNKFISQEERESAAYLYARLSVRCTGDASCTIAPNDQLRQCRQGVCDSASGVCVYNVDPSKENNACPLPYTVPHPHPQCRHQLCVSGECVFRPKTGTLNQPCNSSTGVSPQDSCAEMRCDSSGICVTVDGPGSPNCSRWDSVVASNLCTGQRCTTKVCTTYATLNQACTPTGVTLDTRCSRGTCKTKPGNSNLGTCSIKKINRGSAQNIGACSALTTLACKWKQCQDKPGTYPHGTCTHSNMAQNTVCGSAGECQERKCNSAGSCVLSNKATTTTCTGIPAQECKLRRCNGEGACGYINAGAGGACTGITAPSSTCVKRECTATGTCTYSVAAGVGTCSTAAVPKASCKVRGCVGTSSTLSGAWAKCAYTSNRPNGGSCDSGSGRPNGHTCVKRLCQEGKCVKVPNDSSPTGSCTSTPTLGTATGSTAVPFQECRMRRCNITATTATCYTIPNTGLNGQSCTGPTGGDCTASQCLSGSCGIRNVSTGSCKNSGIVVSPDPNQCQQRLCGQAGAPAGQCGVVISAGGSCGNHWSTQYNNGSGLGLDRSCVNLVCAANGTCLIQLKNNNVECASGPCTVSTCQNGVCVQGNRADGYHPATCTGTTTSCRRPECIAGSCTQNVIHNVGGSCTGPTPNVCSNRLCDSTGTCKLFYKNNPTQTCDNHGGNSGCIVKRCGNLTTGVNAGKGTCIDFSSSKLGSSCGNTPSGACFIQQCSGSGQCIRRADASRSQQACDIGLHCANKRSAEDESVAVASRTLVSRDLNPPLVGSSDCAPKAAVDAGCYAYRCDTGGQCKSIALNELLGCGPTPPNAIQNGTTFACRRYVCQEGTCNTNPAQTQPILEGEFCSGFEPCSPTTPGCNSECQAYRCRSGTCVFDTREGQTCDYPKRASYRRQEEGDGSDILVPTECQESRCRGGRCAIWSVEDGTGCGDRLDNECANDTCIEGQCVPSETNCSFLIPPSVCFDVTCNPESGDCELQLNGVVDCTCISECSACTQVNRVVNDLAANVSETNLTTQNGACWWCPEAEQPGCYNRINFETGEVYLYPDPESGEPTEKPHPSCFTDEDNCAGGGDLSGGEIAGIVVAAVVVSSVAAAALGAAILLARFLRHGSATGEDAVLAAAAFDNTAHENPFHASAWTTTNIPIQADSVPSAHFITQ